MAARKTATAKKRVSIAKNKAKRKTVARKSGKSRK